MGTELAFGERRPARLPSGIDTGGTVTFLKELLFVLHATNLEEDAEWLFRFKANEVAGWSDQREARPPDVFWTRVAKGPVGTAHFRVRNGVGCIVLIHMNNGE